MDDEPFVSVDFAEVAENRISENAFDAFVKLRKETFDPADVGADAQRKIHVAAYLDTLERLFKQPHEDFVKTLMDLAGIEGRRAARLVEEHTLIVAEAINILFDKKLLERVGFADRQDLVRVTETDTVSETGEEDVSEGEIVEQPKSVDLGIVTPKTELRVFSYVKYRLPFLIEREEDLFRKLEHIFMKDFRNHFTVNYKQERKGRLFNFKEGTDPKYRFEFTESDVNIDTDDLSDIDDELLAVFLQRVEELG